MTLGELQRLGDMVLAGIRFTPRATEGSFTSAPRRRGRMREIPLPLPAEALQTSTAGDFVREELCATETTLAEIRAEAGAARASLDAFRAENERLQGELAKSQKEASELRAAFLARPYR